MNTLEALIQKDCPFEPWQFLDAYAVLDWLWDNVDDVELRKWHMEGVHSRLNYYLFNYFYNKMGLKPIGKCSIAELEAEINRRKEEQQ